MSTVAYGLNPRNIRVVLLMTGALAALAFGVWQVASPKWTSVAFVGMLMAALALCKIEVAIVIYTLTAFLLIGPFFKVTGRFGYSEGLYPSELLLGLLVFMWGIRLILLTIKDKRVPLRRSPIDAPLFSFVGAGVFSFVAAQFMWDYRVPTEHRYFVTQISDLGLLFLPVAAYLLVSNTINDTRWIKAVYWSVLVVGLIGFWSDCPWAYVPEFLKIRWTGLLIVPLISFLYSYIVLRKEFDVKLLFAVCSLAALLLVQFAYMSWVTMWLSASVSLCVVSWYRSKKLFAVVLCVALLILLFRGNLFEEILRGEEESYSLRRFDIWASSIKMALGRPLWGIGPGNFYSYYSHYYASLYKTLNVPSAHSLYVQIFTEYGLLGIGSFVWFLVTSLRILADSFRRVSDYWQRTFFLGMLGLFSGFAVISFLGDYFVCVRSNDGLAHFGITVYLWLLLGLAMSVRRGLLNEDAGPERIRSNGVEQDSSEKPRTERGLTRTRC